MVHHYQKRWVFTWNADQNASLPDCKQLTSYLDSIAVEGVFQLERGLKTARLHYQGRFNLKGSRQGKRRLLELFSQAGFDVKNLTLEPERLYDSSKYCSKSETRVEGPWFVGPQAYKFNNQKMELDLKPWMIQLMKEIRHLEYTNQQHRKVIWVEDSKGGAGKSRFLKYLCFGDSEWEVEKLPIDKPDRIRMAICKMVQKKNVDIFAFDFTRTRGEDTSLKDLFEVVEEIKNGHVVSVMYGNPMSVGFNSPHVIIFTNESLSGYHHYLSADRWVPTKIQGDTLHLFKNTFSIYDPYDYKPQVLVQEERTKKNLARMSLQAKEKKRENDNEKNNI